MPNCWQHGPVGSIFNIQADANCVPLYVVGQLLLTLLAPAGSGSGFYTGDPAGLYDALTQVSVGAVADPGLSVRQVGRQSVRRQRSKPGAVPLLAQRHRLPGAVPSGSVEPTAQKGEASVAWPGLLSS